MNMGADITLSVNGRLEYYRDAYNHGNLAWVSGLSYWKTKGNKAIFMKKLSQTTNQKIESYIKSKKLSDTFKNVLISKRNQLKQWFEEDPHLKVIGWSV